MSNLRRAIRLLELLTDEPDGARLTDLAQALGVNRAIPFRALAELADMGYVHQHPASERYSATFKLGALGLKQLETAGLRRWSDEALRELADKTKELVRLAVVSDSSLRWVAKAQGSNSALLLDPANGSEAVLHATATGKAWLATHSDDEVRKILGKARLAQRTPKTKTNLKAVLDEVAAARKLGYAVTQEEMDVGISAVAVPVVPRSSEGGHAVATVSVAGPSARLTKDALAKFVPEVQKTANRLAAEWDIYVHLADKPGSVSSAID